MSAASPVILGGVLMLLAICVVVTIEVLTAIHKAYRSFSANREDASAPVLDEDDKERIERIDVRINDLETRVVARGSAPLRRRRPDRFRDGEQ